MRDIPLKYLGEEIFAMMPSPANTAHPAPRDEAAIRAYYKRNGPPIEYKRTLIDLLETGKNLSVSEIRSRRKLADKLDDATGSVLVEEEEFALLRRVVDTAEWSAATRNLIIFLDDVLDAPTVEVAAVEKKKG